MLTDAGAQFLSRLDPILVALDDAEQSVRQGGDLRGMLRMSMPSSVGTREVIPRLASFMVLHPELRIEVMLGDRPQDLVRDAVDVAIRLGRLVDSTATALLIATITRVVVASPAYLAVHGVPDTPKSLSQHRIVGGPASGARSRCAAGAASPMRSMLLAVASSRNSGISARFRIQSCAMVGSRYRHRTSMCNMSR